MRSSLSSLTRIKSTLTTLQARWSYPRNHYYLCYTSLLALAMPMLRYLPLAWKPPKLPCQTSNPIVLANRCLAMLLLCSAPLIALLSCRWRLEFVPFWYMFIVGIPLLYLVYFNAPIYLVKGGRLGLLPGVLFHSCRPSFRHTGVMFLDFCVPYAVGL